MAMKMAKVQGCSATGCAYNMNQECHTMAITVGEKVCPMCDTFMEAGMKGGDKSIKGTVGACKSADCKFNKSFECSADKISVGLHAGHPDCMTFASR